MEQEPLNLDLLNFERLDAELDRGRVLKAAEAEYLCEYCMTHHSWRNELLHGVSAYDSLSNALREWLRTVAWRRFPDAAADRFTWRVREESVSGYPLLWFRNDQTGLVLLWYRPTPRERKHLRELLDLCVRALFPVLGVREEITELYLRQPHEIRGFPGHFEPEDAWLELMLSGGRWPLYACNVHVQTKSACVLAKQPLLPDRRTPLVLLSTVLHRLAKLDPREPGAVFVKRSYVFLAVPEPDGTAGAAEPKEAPERRPGRKGGLRAKSRSRALGEDPRWNDADSRYEPWGDGRFEISAEASFYGLQDAVNRCLGWKRDWNRFWLPATGLQVVDDDWPDDAILDASPDEIRDSSGMQLFEYFEQNDFCEYASDSDRCRLVLLERKAEPVPGPEAEYLRRVRYLVEGGIPLHGDVRISGSARAAIAVLSAAVMSRGPVTVRNVPDTPELRTFLAPYAKRGYSVSRPDPEDRHTVCIRPAGSIFSLGRCAAVNEPELCLVRHSACLIGAFLGAFGRVYWNLPAPAVWGPHPLAQQLRGFQAMGAQAELREGRLFLYIPPPGGTGYRILKGAQICLDVPDFDDTVGLMLAAVRAQGNTVIENACTDPDVADLACFLNAAGAQVLGAGTERIQIRGVNHLHEADHTLFPDRTEAGFYLSLAAAAGGDVTVHSAAATLLSGLTEILSGLGTEVSVITEEYSDAIRVRRTGPLQKTSAAQAGKLPPDLLPVLQVCTDLADGTAPQSGRLEAASPDVLPGMLTAALAAPGNTQLDCGDYPTPVLDHMEEKLRTLGARLEVAEFLSEA